MRNLPYSKNIRGYPCTVAMITGLLKGWFKNTCTINTDPMVSGGSCKVNTREINYYKWIQMSF